MDASVNGYAELFVLKLLNILFQDIADLDSDMIKQNMHLATSDGFSENDRSIRVDLAKYLLQNFGYFRHMLITCENVRKACVFYIQREMDADGYSDEDLYALRMREFDFRYDGTEDVYVVNLSRYDVKMADDIKNTLIIAMESTSALDESDTKDILSLTEKDRMFIGYCASNFMYFIRALAKNYTLIDIVERGVARWQDYFNKYLFIGTDDIDESLIPYND